MNKIILPLIGAVGAFYLYKKYAENQAKTTDAGATEEDAALGGGGGGGAAAPSTIEEVAPVATEEVAPVATEEVKMNKAMKVGQIKPSQAGVGIRPASKPNRVTNVRLGSKPPMNMGLSRTRIVSTNPRDKYAGYMDFDSNPDVFGDMM